MCFKVGYGFKEYAIDHFVVGDTTLDSDVLYDPLYGNVVLNILYGF